MHSDIQISSNLKEVKMSYIRIYADQSGESHFQDVDVEMTLADFAPPAPPINLSHFWPSTVVGFLHFPAGWYGKPHPTPKAQFLIGMSGDAVVTTSDGDKRNFTAGTVLLVEDTWGKGHTTCISEHTELQAMAIQLPD